MENVKRCFNHDQIEGVDKCAVCRKTYCGNCLKLAGEFKMIVCVNCHQLLSSKYVSSIKRRKAYIGIGALVFAMLILIYLAGSNSSLITAFLPLLLILLPLSIAVNVIRIRQMKKFMASTEDYAKAE